MADTESRALQRAAAILMLASVLRLGWARLSPPAEPLSGPDAADTLLAASRRAVLERDARTRPLAEDERLDPNRASAIELDRLPGVGAKTAEAIVRSREEEGPFRGPEDLVRVRGIGEATVRRIPAHLDVSTPMLGRFRPSGPGGPATPVDVNRADEALLQTLPGVGPALARRIIEARAEAPFRAPDDLLRVRGIGPATLERMRPRVAVGPR